MQNDDDGCMIALICAVIVLALVGTACYSRGYRNGAIDRARRIVVVTQGADGKFTVEKAGTSPDAAPPKVIGD